MACSIRCGARAKRLRRDRARVLPAHLESNFINPEYSGAQPAACLRSPAGCAWRGRVGRGTDVARRVSRAIRLHRRRHPRRDRARDAGRRHRDAGVGAGRRTRPGALARVARDTASRSDIPARPTTRRSRRSRPARGTRRTSSTACRRSVTARRAWRAPCCRPTRSRRSSSATASTFTRRSSARAIAAKRPSRIFAITDATAAAGLPAGVRRSAGRPTDHRRRAHRAAAPTARSPAAC